MPLLPVIKIINSYCKKNIEIYLIFFTFLCVQKMCICSTACDIKLTDMPIYFKPLIYLLTYRQKQKYVSTLLLANCKKK